MAGIKRHNAGKRLRRALLAGGLITAGLTAFAVRAVAAPPVGPAPATTHPVALTASPTDGLLPGQTVTLAVNTSGGTTLIGSLSVHVCEPGHTGYGLTNFGYSGAPASRCVYQQGIVSGGLAGADYEKKFGPYAGSETSTGPLPFHAGTGSVTWGNDSGFGPFTVQADSTHPVDLVVQVNLAGDSVGTTYFTQQITFATVPDAPTAVVAGAGNGSASVSLTPPASDGGSPITGYAVSCVSSNGGTPGSDSGATLPVVVSGLTNGDTYTCTATATNGAGTSAVSDPSSSFVPEAVPNPPTSVTATGGNGSASVSFVPPTDNGDGVITGYDVSCVSSNGGVSGAASGADSPLAVSGLSNGKTYTCTATATNAVGTSIPSVGSSAFVPATVPVAPTAVTAVAANAKATLHWTAPANAASSAITSYVITGYIGYFPAVTQTFAGNATTATVTGLTNGSTYRFKVAAKNATKTGAQSPATAAVTAGAPAAPTAVKGTAGSKQVSVHWTAPANNGAAITGYVVCVYVGGAQQKTVTFNSVATTEIVKGLTTGTHYTFKVLAKNARGAGPRSAASASVTAN